MARATTSAFFNLSHARWLAGVLGLLVGVVGRDSLLGLILRQARSEVVSLVRAEGPGSACHHGN